MFTKSLMTAAVVTCAFAGQALAWNETQMVQMGQSTLPAGAPLYAYGGPNNCPGGLQPIVLNGVICCGVPNRAMSYQQVIAHPAPRRVVRRQKHTHTQTHTHMKTHTHTQMHSH